MTVYTLPEIPLLMAPTVGQVAEACDGEVIAGNAEGLGREAMGLLVAAMTVERDRAAIDGGA